MGSPSPIAVKLLARLRASPALSLAWLLILVAAALRFFHLTADFPNHSPWALDQAKFTDEGWWANAAILHRLLGHWALPGDYNPAAALPVWPLLLGLLFHFTGVSLAATRALTAAFSVATLAVLYPLARRYAGPRGATLAVLLLATSPFAFVYSRLGTLETCVVFQFCLLLLWMPTLIRRRALAWTVLPLLIAAMALTKTTALVLLPALLWLGFAELERTPGRGLTHLARALLGTVLLPALLLRGYALLVDRLGHGGDYRYFFDLNGMPVIVWSHTAPTLLTLLRNGLWVDPILYPLGLAILIGTFIAALRGRPGLGRNPFGILLGNALRKPLFGVAVLALPGPAAFLFGRQGDYAPRYFLLLLVPLILIVVLGLHALTAPGIRTPGDRPTVAGVAAGCIRLAIVLAVALNLATLVRFTAQRTQQWYDAGLAIRRIVLADPTVADPAAAQPRLILGVSASELSLVTQVPSLNDAFGVEDLAARLRRYHPGWYLVWNGPDLGNPAFAPYRLQEQARFQAFDDDDRRVLILYKLLPRSPSESATPVATTSAAMSVP